MKKLSLVLLAMMGLPVAGWAAFQAVVIAGPKEGPGMPVAFQASLGLLNGKAKEHVYDHEGPGGSRRQLSRLDWDLKGIAMGGVNASARLSKKLTINGGYWAALTQGSGEMSDYDWLNTSSPDWTHYSLSTVDVTAGYILDLNVAWDLVSLEALTARVFAGYKQNGWTWTDHGVYLLYPEFNYVPQDLHGENMINYEQVFRMPYLGANADWALGNFTVSGSLTYSPIVAATDWDEHVQRDLHFTEKFDGGTMMGVGLEVRYGFTQGSLNGLFLSAGLDYQKIDRIIGDMEVQNIKTGETGSDTGVAGIENEYTSFSLGGGINF